MPLLSLQQVWVLGLRCVRVEGGFTKSLDSAFIPGGLDRDRRLTEQWGWQRAAEVTSSPTPA